MRESWEVTSLEEKGEREKKERKRWTDKETWCFQKGLEGRSES